MRPCFAFTPAAKDKPAVLSILEEIGFWGTQAKDFLAQLGQVEGPKLRLEISSPGGDVFAAMAMYNGLRASGKEITSVVMGVAASAASLVYLAGDVREAPKNAMVMIHNPWSFAMGNAEELREQADTLEKIGNSVKATYLARTGMKDEALTAMLAKGTWLDADEALANGFATVVTEDVQANAKFDLDKAELPDAARKAYAKAVAKVPPAPKPEDVIDESPLAEQVMVLATAAGLDVVAGDLAINCKTIDEAKTRVASGREIMALCKVAKKDDLAPAMIRKNTSVADARAAIVKAMADEDTTVVTTPPIKKQSSSQNASAQVTTESIWASHRKQTEKSTRK